MVGNYLTRLKIEISIQTLSTLPNWELFTFHCSSIAPTIIAPAGLSNAFSKSLVPAYLAPLINFCGSTVHTMLNY